MNVACPECRIVYRIDSDRVPEDGVRTRCRECDTALRIVPLVEALTPGHVIQAQRIEAPAQAARFGGRATVEADAPAAAAPAAEPRAAEPRAAEPPAAEPRAAEPRPVPGPGARPAGGPVPAPSHAPGTKPVFGPQDPLTRALRLARALVSDVKVYNRDRWARSREAGTLRKDFREDILRSWDEYVEQVGEDMAKRTPFFRDALNEILAEGDRIF
jgi:predicted Zn finger-like uncharacterized protein